MNFPQLANEIVRPDYAGGGIVNLMASISRAFAAPTHYEMLALLPPDELAEPRNVVLLVIDGLGANYLDRYADSFLRQQQRGRITTVFPSTTASAISTYLSGLAPQQHGIVGWFTYLKELGSVATILPFKPRHGGPTYARMGIDPRMIFSWEPFFNRLNARSFIISRRDIVDSDYSVATGGKAARLPYDNLDGCLERIKQVLGRPGSDRQYVYAYWPALDATAHQFGVNSVAAREHFWELDRKIACFAEQAKGSSTVLIVCADHGLVDTRPEQSMSLDAHPELARLLALPLTGEPRAAYCHVRSASRRAFEAYVESAFAAACFCIDSESLVNAEGWFGPGAPHPALLQRVGDYTLVMRDSWTLKDRLPTEKPFQQIGVHGGLTPDEIHVPLIVTPL